MPTKVPRICDEIVKQSIAFYEYQKEQTKDEKIIKLFDSIIKNMKSGKNHKYDLDNCKMAYLNPKCDGTLFEPGDDKMVAKKMMDNVNKIMPRKYKYKPGTKPFNSLKKFYIDTRKELFKNDSSVLSDGFYKGLSAKDVAQLKENGAISGCTKTNEFKNITIKPLKNNKTGKLGKTRKTSKTRRSK